MRLNSRVFIESLNLTDRQTEDRPRTHTISYTRELATGRRRDERPERVEVPSQLFFGEPSCQFGTEQPQIVPPFIHDR